MQISCVSNFNKSASASASIANSLLPIAQSPIAATARHASPYTLHHHLAILRIFGKKDFAISKKSSTFAAFLFN